MITFENYDRKIEKINKALAAYGITSLEDAEKICKDKGIDPYQIAWGIQPICFEDVCWAYVAGAAIAIQKGCSKANEAAKAIGEGLQAFCLPGSVAEDRKVGLGHGNLAAMLLSEETECFAFLAGHESFAAAEGAIGIAKSANKVRKKPLRVILNGLGKDAAQIISRINGFTYVQTQFVRFRIPRANARKCAATVRTTCARALPSCTRKAWMFPLPAIPRTRPVSSIRSQAHTKRNVSNRARNISLWLAAAVQAERCIRITWRQDLLPTA